MTKEDCFIIAKQFSSILEFESNSTAHDVFIEAQNNGWLEEWFPSRRKPNGYWTYEKCFEEALKYSTRQEFQYAKGASRAYKAAVKNGWIEDYYWFIPIRKKAGYWTESNCFEEAKKYQTKEDFKQKSPSAYAISCRKGWMIKFDWLKSKLKKWTYEDCLIESKKYHFRGDFRHGSPVAYNASLRNGWINDYTWLKHKTKPSGYWTEERCMEESKKYQSKTEFMNMNSAAYSIAHRNGWLANYVWLTDKRVDLIDGKIDFVYAYVFTETKSVYVGRTVNPKERDYAHIFLPDRDSVAKYALEHNCSIPKMTILEKKITLKEGQEKEDYWRLHFLERGYNIINKAATGLGRSSLGSLSFGKWNWKTCYEEAKKYKTKSDFIKNNGSAYSAARKNGWLKEYIWLKNKRHETWTYEACLQESLKYQTRTQFARACAGAYDCARKKGWLVDFFKNDE